MSDAGGAPRILLVCTGNTCRSPIAEALLGRAAAGLDTAVTVSSAGIGALDDAPASDAARIVAREAGLDLEGHRARLLTRPMVLESDLVLAMGARHYDFIRVLAPEALDRVHVLRSYATGGAEGGDVRDPFGGDLETYRRTLEELRRLVEQSLQRWRRDEVDRPRT